MKDIMAGTTTGAPIHHQDNGGVKGAHPAPGEGYSPA